ncbi:Transcriptional regulator, IclR family [Candidatus Burkholderia humilis]|nr:Transcriptional regulator, IclR family [Candidatus Burkholderia humilis]
MTSDSTSHLSRSDDIDERKFVVALTRGLDMLRVFRPGETLLGNRDFAERTGLPKATVNRLAYTLTTLDYLHLDDTAGKYALDTGVLSLGFALLADADTLELARPYMRAREIGAAVSLRCRDGLDMIYLETIRSETALTLGFAPGSRLSMLMSSMGRAYLAVQEPAAREALLEEFGDVQEVEAARRAIEDFERDGCCYSFRDVRNGRWLVLSSSGPASSMGEAYFRETIGPKLKALAARLA